jgi:hypothetical protein
MDGWVVGRLVDGAAGSIRVQYPANCAGEGVGPVGSALARRLIRALAEKPDTDARALTARYSICITSI